MALRRIDFDALERAVLYVLHEAFMGNGPAERPLTDIQVRLSTSPLNAVRECIDSLVIQELVKQKKEAGGSIFPMPFDVPIYVYSISRKGIELVSGWSDYTVAEVEKFVKAAASPKLRGPLAPAEQGIETIETKVVPASDRIVELNHNSQEYFEAVEALDKVTDAVRSNNEYAEGEPEDRDQRLAELEAAKTLLNAPRVSESAIKTLAINTLKYLGEKFADHAIGALAAGAIAALLALIGHLL